ncbi:MAG: PcfJ domain-containing protein [Alphaproteobacteria bacterium]|nr:PcfJ domain-containing protein [Alphaproteobacteria bacterium]
MTNDFIEFLPDMQSVNSEITTGFTLFCDNEKLANAIRLNLLCDFHIHSMIDFDDNGAYSIIPLETPDDKTMQNFIFRGWNWDKSQKFIHYAITLYNQDATIKLYNMLVARGYDAILINNNMQLTVKCLDDSPRNTEIKALTQELIKFQKSSPVSLDNYFNKLLFCGKIEKTEYRQIRKQEFSLDEVEQERDIIIRGMLYQYFYKRIRSYLMPTVFSKKFDANKLDDKTKRNINLIRDYLYAVAEKYIDMQMMNAIRTNHSIFVRFDYLKSCNQYKDYRSVLKLAKQWYKEKLQKEKIKEYNLRMSEKGTYKIMNCGPDYYVVQLFTPKAPDFEGSMLNHCAGDGYYDNQVHKENVQIYSIRDYRGIPHLTLEVNDGKIVQCYGYKNHVPCDAKLRQVVRALMRQEKLDLPDINSWNKLIAYIKQDGVLYDLFDLPKDFIAQSTINLSGMDLHQLPDMSTVKVKGDFWCPTNQLSTIDGAPYSVSGHVKLSYNPITSLRGFPRHVGGKIYLSHTNLTAKSFVPLYIENKLDDIIGLDDKTIAAWKQQIAQRKHKLQTIITSLSQRISK